MTWRYETNIYLKSREGVLGYHKQPNSYHKTNKGTNYAKAIATEYTNLSVAYYQMQESWHY